MKLVAFYRCVACFLFVGLFGVHCAELNPNTDGHILSSLEAKQSELKACYVVALERDRELRGMIGLRLQIDDDPGQVTHAEVEESNIEDKEMHQCVATVAEEITLAEPPGVAVEAHYDVEFDFE